MDSPKIVYKYYSNPAFCGQSETVQKCRTPDRRMQPLGGNSPRKTVESNRILRTDISDNPLRMSPAGAVRRDEPPELPPKPKYLSKSFHRQASLICKPSRTVRCRTRSEDLEMAQFKQQRKVKYDRNAESDDGLEDSRLKHRYEIIRDDFEDIIDYSPTKKRIVEADADEIEEYNVDAPDDNELKEVPTEIVKTVNGKTQRYAIVPIDDPEPPRKVSVTFSSPIMSKKNLIATQKLHELLSTPRKLKSYASQPSVRITPNKSQDSPRYLTPQKLVSSTPTKMVTPSKSCANLSISKGTTSPISPKAQQKLNYGFPEEFERTDVFVTSFREKSRDRSLEMDRRDLSRESRREYEGKGREVQRKDKTTAVIIPR